MRIQILILGLNGLNGILSDIVLCGSGAGKSLVCFSSCPKHNYFVFLRQRSRREVYTCGTIVKLFAPFFEGSLEPYPESLKMSAKQE